METTTGIAPIGASTTTSDPDSYRPMLEALRDHFANGGDGPLFTTDVDPDELWAAWLSGFPAEERQHHNCHSCRRFLQQFGGLVDIDEDGIIRPAVLVFEAPGTYGGAFDAASKLFQKARVNGVFLSSSPIWGTPSNLDAKRGLSWQHLHIVPAKKQIFQHAILSASQRSAELGEEYKMLSRALGELKAEHIRTALSIAEADALYRGEKVEGRLRWLLELHEARTDARHRGVKENLVWLAVAEAPAGFAHVRSSVIGSLLEDIEAGKSFEAVKRAFDAKMHPLQYQRPQAAPSAGNIAQAEAIVEKMGIASSLRRRFARLEDVKALWTPPAPKEQPKGEGVFGHLKPGAKGSEPMQAKGATLTFSKFEKTVLPGAERIEVFAPTVSHYTAFTVAADAAAPPILQWDSVEERNSVAWYTYQTPSPATSWALMPGTFVPVTAIALMPNMWRDREGFKHQGQGAMFILAGCKDKKAPEACLFPETLRSELHSIRATIEAFSKRAPLEGYEEASACGLTIRSEMRPGSTVRCRVLSRGTLTEYTLDRWD